MHKNPTVHVELDPSRIRSVHTGGMKMDDESPSYDIYEDPYIITTDGVKHYVSQSSAREAQCQSRDNDYDDGFGYSAAG